MTNQPATVVLRIGAKVIWDGALCEIVEFAGGSVVLRSAKGAHFRIRFVELLIPAVEGGRARLATFESSSAASPVVVWQELSGAELERVRTRADHIRELLTGYRSGSPAFPRAGEPQPQYAPDASMTSRVQAKARELGVGERTIWDWKKRYEDEDEVGLARRTPLPGASGAREVDPRWLDMARTILREQHDGPRIPTNILMQRIEARLERVHGPGVVRIPSKSAQYEKLRQMSDGRNILEGSTKGKRSIANRPKGGYGRLAPGRPGEYVLLDSTRLDVFAFDERTGRWLNSELTVAIDLYSRAIIGLRVVPTTRSLDVAGVLLEAMLPVDIAETRPALAVDPYVGVPDTLIIHDEHIDVARFRRAMIPDAIVVDHGKPFVSEHVLNVCARLGISVQPARVYMPTDKAAVERFFRTLTSLLANLPGYKGPDLSARGRSPEDESVYTFSELEEIIREWVATVYHRSPHSGLFDPLFPGVELSPQQRYEQGIAHAGTLRMPKDRNVMLEMLPVIYRKFNHYGVQNDNLVYTSDIVTKYRDLERKLHTEQKRKWPFSVNPDDLRYLYFHDPDDGVWHTLTWNRISEINLPFSIDALDFAKKLVLSGGEDAADIAAAMNSLLAKWGAGKELTPTERRASARLAVAQRRAESPTQVTSLDLAQTLLAEHRNGQPTLAAELVGAPLSTLALTAPEAAGDDDLDEELDPTEEDHDQSDFYATALEDL
ncbi:hypothetical protein [Microbacterium sp.]|uniref:hypothetical protein n=1 Tax=Microbacterium sp. TaxID=51671 RepID=UPI0032420BA9